MIAFFRSRQCIAVLVFFAGLFLFTAGLSQQEIIGFESRFYLFAQEMWRQGPSWFPTTYGVPYPDYPVTTTFFIYCVSKIAGHLNKFTAVLPSAMAASLTLSMTYLIGSLHNARWGLFAVFFLLLTHAFVMEARTISPDQFVAAATTCSFYFAYSAARFDNTRYLKWIPFFFLFGFLCRGPIGLVIPAGVVFIFYFVEKKWRHLFLMSAAAAGMLFVGSLLLFSLAYHVGGDRFLHEVWRMEVSGRLQDASLSWYFYFVESLGAYAMTYPLALLVFLGVVFSRDVTERDKHFLLTLLAWVLVIMVGLSIPAGKKIRYVLAMSPALALSVAALFGMAKTSFYLVFLRQCVYAVCLFLPGFCCAVLGGIVFYGVFPAIFHGVSIAIVFLVLMLWQVSVLTVKRSEYVVGCAALTFLLMILFVVEPINLQLKAGRDFVLSVEKIRREQKAALVFYRENPDGTPIKYLVNMPETSQPIFLNNVDELQQYHGSAIFIADPAHFSALPFLIKSRFKVLQEGSVGHDPLIVFTRF